MMSVLAWCAGSARDTAVASRGLGDGSTPLEAVSMSALRTPSTPRSNTSAARPDLSLALKVFEEYADP
jgi:hypothetical protein